LYIVGNYTRYTISTCGLAELNNVNNWKVVRLKWMYFGYSWNYD